ncbi:hypothetical protein Nham_3014 [Nitrobacter hamburgensis X14]|uniref:Transposase n=1 Tax=Nitrobacter hamburgensis (strain DSM 10229 / NCIMB 13809 / X14) TaxID=323097 RepID=Q1QJ33_NITHX|nr:hypothetical protein Nham_3014 [Nitrobacter hamburgensis X14]
MRIWRMRTGVSIAPKPADRRRLKALARDRNAPHKHVWRAEIVLLSADGFGTNEIMRRTGTSKICVWRWQERFMQAGYDGLLHDKTRPSRIRPLGSKITERVVALTQTEPPAEATHWTYAMMAQVVDISASSVQRIWRAHGLQPHRVKQFKLSTDPQFVDKLRDIVGSMSISRRMRSIRPPPAHAIVLSVDEKSQIQALDRTQPGLPIKPGRAGTMILDYKRHGTTTLFAALNVLDGTVIGRNMLATGTRSSSASSMPLRRRYRSKSRSTPSSTTTLPTNIQRCANGWHGIPAGPSTSPQPRHHGSTPSSPS